eukprot:scaffold2.g7182.t1
MKLRAAVALVDVAEEEEEDGGNAGAHLELVAPFEVVQDSLGDYQPRTFSSLMGDSDTDEEAEVVDESLLLVNCGLSPVTVNALESRGIRALFPIQKQVFTPAMDGADLIARARTGSGKTLAFSLPVIEKILAAREGSPRARGARLPQCIVLAPTRELAKQVEREMAGAGPSLKVGCYYGGTPIGPQLRELRHGVDVVVGTPGRVIDLIDQDALDLSQVRFVVLDEADQMLNVGFEKDVETILNNVPTERQTMLFSATVPKWVKKLVKTYLNDPVTVDLVGDAQSGKMADTITALAVQVTDDTRRSILVDLLTVYGAGGKSIVFTQTKREADEVAASVVTHLTCGALHGDMGQREREKVLQSFRDDKLAVLVATDVAARGLDIPEVDLVVHYELPQDPEGFLHRSGRTGRAGRSGTAIAMFTRKEIGYFKRILRETETTHVSLISPPTPREVVEAAAKQVMTRLDGVDSEVRAFFAPVARLVLSSKDPQEALETALAALSGITELPEARSLLTLEEGLVTMQMLSEPGRITRPAHISAILGRLFGPDNHEVLAKVGKIRILSDASTGMEGGAFDVPAEVAPLLLAKEAELAKRKVFVSQPSSLPPEEDLYSSSPRRGGRFGGGDSDDAFWERRRQQQGRGGERRGGSFGGERRGGSFGGERRGGSGGERRGGGGGRADGGWYGGRDGGRDGGRRDDRRGGDRFDRKAGSSERKSGGFERAGGKSWDLGEWGGAKKRGDRVAREDAWRGGRVRAAAGPQVEQQLLTKEDLVSYLASGCKPREDWRIGTEHEKLGYNLAEPHRRLDYEQIRALLSEIRARFGWAPIMEGEHLIGLEQEGQSVTLEPGGQFELSGATVDTLHKTCAEVNSHLYQARCSGGAPGAGGPGPGGESGGGAEAGVCSISEEMGIGFLGVGFDPKWHFEDVPRMPKQRYKIMREYMPTRGSLGLDMMCGTLPWVFEPGFGFEHYVDYVLDVPMYFVYRGGTYHNVAGQSFRDFMRGALPGLPGVLPTLKDWESHLTTVFPEVRLKRFLEMRGADGGPWRLICGLPALWAQAEAAALVADWTQEEREYLRLEVPRTALKTPFRGGTVQDLAKEVLAISARGLERRGRQEGKFLKELQARGDVCEIAESGETQAEALLRRYEGEWGRSVDPLYNGEFSY